MAATGETRTYCIGRYLVDVPSAFELVELGASVRAIRFERLGSGDARDAERLTNEKIKALKNGEVVEDSWPQLLRDVERIGAARIISTWDDYSVLGYEPSEPWGEEMYLSSEGALFRLEGVATERSAHTKREQMLAVAAAIRPRDGDEIPRGVGLCASSDTYIALPPGEDAYGGKLYAEGIASLRFSIVERGKAGPAIAEMPSFNVPSRPITIARMQGEQLRLPNGDRVEYGGFASNFDSTGLNGVLIDVELYVFDRNTLPQGVSGPDDLWNGIIASIRRKP